MCGKLARVVFAELGGDVARRVPERETCKDARSFVGKGIAGRPFDEQAVQSLYNCSALQTDEEHFQSYAGSVTNFSCAAKS